MKGKQLVLADLFSHPANFFALGFGAGLAPKAPGTLGTLVAVPIVLFCNQYGWQFYLLITFLLILSGLWLCGVTAKNLGVHDHSGIVWDEIAGFMVTMIAVPTEWQWLCLGFVLFRFFDILKPWPIGWLDRQVHGGLGIMLDDIVAGVMSLIVLQMLLLMNA